jgi:hypothetical protein
MGDTSDGSGIGRVAQGCDVLVHESTYASDRMTEAVQRGHACPGAGTVSLVVVSLVCVCVFQSVVSPSLSFCLSPSLSLSLSLCAQC